MANGKHKEKHATGIIETKNNSVAIKEADDYSAYAGQGFEDQTRDDQAVPFLGIIQSNSPIIETKASAKAGMLVNTVTQDIYDGKKGVSFVPVKTEKYFVEWKPRTLGGGFVKMHDIASDLVEKTIEGQEFGKYKMKKGDENSNDLVQTYYVYGILANENSYEPIIMAFTSTKIKAYKNWMTKANTIQIPLPDGRRISGREIPLFAHKYRITTLGEKNAKGSFFNFSVSFDGEDAKAARLPTNDPLFQTAAAFYDTVKGGKVKAAVDTQHQVGDANEDEIPFK